MKVFAKSDFRQSIPFLSFKLVHLYFQADSHARLYVNCVSTFIAFSYLLGRFDFNWRVFIFVLKKKEREFGNNKI